MGAHTDESYAYSQHLLWGLGEGTSTVLVFCAPAIPIIFNSGRRSSRLKISSSWSPGQRKHSAEHRQLDEYRRMHEGSAIHLQELGQGNDGMGSLQRTEEEHPLHSYLGLGIWKTTEIQVSTHTETNSPTTTRREEKLRHPWTEISGSS